MRGEGADERAGDRSWHGTTHKTCWSWSAGAVDEGGTGEIVVCGVSTHHRGCEACMKHMLAGRDRLVA